MFVFLVLVEAETSFGLIKSLIHLMAGQTFIALHARMWYYTCPNFYVFHCLNSIVSIA